jgi:hypothetical protein
MKIYKISGWYDVKEFDGDTGYEADSGIYFCAVRMKDGTIYYAPNHYDIVLRYKLTIPENKKRIESFGLLEADGSYMVKSKDVENYMENRI